MSKVTSKRQITLPKELADEYGIEPGDEIDWERAGDAIRLVPRKRLILGLPVEDRLAIFDEGSRRHEERWAGRTPDAAPNPPPASGWTRQERPDRGLAD